MLYVDYDMCSFGAPWRKIGRLATTFSEFKSMNKMCTHDHEHVTLIVNREQNETVWREREACYRPSRLEGKRKAARAHEVHAADTVADSAEEGRAIRTEGKVALPVDRATQVAERIGEASTHAANA